MHLSVLMRKAFIGNTQWPMHRPAADQGAENKRQLSGGTKMGYLCHTLSPQDSGIFVEEMAEKCKRQS